MDSAEVKKDPDMPILSIPLFIIHKETALQ
jgi:hypothetical protein